MQKGNVVNKYYTPSIEEFHVGFEFEDSYDNGENFSENCIDELNFKEVVDDLLHLHSNNFKLRVKYLDREGIEGLGFVYNIERNDFEYKGDEYKRLGFDESDHSLMMWNGLDWEDEDVWFDGYIKNKSELKVSLKQLGIS
jgi:hypothetical protein